MVNSSRLRLFVSIILIALVHSGTAQSLSAEDKILRIMSQHDVVGLSVAVVRDGDIVYSKAFGLKNRETGTPLQENDLFRIASISKSFSATAIMQLVESKKVSLNADFGDLVGFKVRNPKYPDIPITLRMVLSHTSSINDSQGYFNLDVINPSKNPHWSRCYNDYAPGSGYEYCNLNFNMTGAVIERLTGERFDYYIKDRILDPLKLTAGFCVDSLDNSLFATLYEYNDSTSQFSPSPMAYAPRREQISNYLLGYTTPIFSPTGGMKISAPDLARYMTMHMNKGKYNGVRIMSKRSARVMQTTIAKESGYGLAIANTHRLIPGELMTGHTGSAYGLYSAMFFQPKKKFGFVVITNGCNPSYKDGYNEVIREVIISLYDGFIKSDSL